MSRRRNSVEFENTYNLPTGEAIRRELVRMFRRQRGRAVASILRAAGTKEAAGIPAVPYNPHDDTPEDVTPFVPLLAAVYDKSGKAALASIGLDPDAWDVTDPNAAEAIEGAAFQFCSETNATTHLTTERAVEKLRTSLMEGVVKEGAALKALVDRVQEIYTSAERWRARRIAMTESMRAHHAALLMTARQSGVVVGLKWMLSGDACEQCHAVARRAGIVRLGQPFAIVPSNQPAYSQILHPPLHPHCACTVEQILEPDDATPIPFSDTVVDLTPDAADVAAAEGTAAPLPTPAGVFVAPPIVPQGGHALGPKPDRKPATRPVSFDDDDIYVPPAKPPKKKPGPKPGSKRKPKGDGFPADPNTLQVVRTLPGSTQPELVRDPTDGALYVRKRPKPGGDPLHLAEEATADALYRAAGLEVPAGRLYATPNGPVKLTRFVENATELGQVKGRDPALYAAAVEKVKQGFAVDCLYANWDVVGMGKNNILVDPNGNILRADNGGSLRYRAQGKLKGSLFGNVVGEIQSLRSPSVNPDAADVFGSLTDAEVKKQIKALYRRRAKILDAAPADLKTILSERLDNMKAWADAKAPKAKKLKGTYTERSLSDGHAWAMRVWGRAVRKIPAAERMALVEYTGSAYGPMNGAMRGRRVASSRHASQIAAADAAMENIKTPENVIVWRGLTLSDTNVPAPKIGDTITDYGFTSTTVDKSFARRRGRDQLEIRLPKGTPALYLEPITAVSGEYELLLPRRVSGMTVVEIRRDPDGTVWHVCEPVIDPAPPGDI